MALAVADGAMIGVLAPSSRAQAVAKDNATPPSPSTPFQSFTNVSSDRSRFITKDWQVSPIISMFTGNPIQITGGKNISLSGQNLDRPNVILPDQVYGAPKTVLQYLNPAAFQCAGSNSACTVFSGQFGNLGRNSLYGPGQRNFDIAVSRQFQMRERFKMEFRSDFFNILNHANWNNPVSSLSSAATFGQITTFGSPRIIQMAMKLYF